MLTKPPSELLDIDKIDPTIADIRDRIQRAISRPVFLALFAIDPDTLHLALCAKLRESTKLTKAENENLEQLVWDAMQVIILLIFVSQRELKSFNQVLTSRMQSLVANSVAQKIVDGTPGW
jgi:ribonuclease HII